MMRPRFLSSSQVSEWFTSDVFVPSRAKFVAEFPVDPTNHEGLFYWLGGSGSWVNPFNVSILISSSSAGTNSLGNTTNRTVAAEWYSANAANSWWQVDIARNQSRRFVLSHFSYQTRSTTPARLQQFKVEGSNDNGTTWDLLLTVADGDLDESVNAWNDMVVVGCNPHGYRHFRLTNTGVTTTGDNYLVVPEVELFGRLVEH